MRVIRHSWFCVISNLPPASRSPAVMKMYLYVKKKEKKGMLCFWATVLNIAAPLTK